MATGDLNALNRLKDVPSDEYPAEHIELSSRRIHEQDVSDLARWGKRQQLKRNFGLISIISLTCTLMITWEGTLAVFGGSLLNGGSAGLIYGFVVVWIGNMLQALVMAELASMMPLAGGQYNWVAILAPKSCSVFLSYLTGWITFLTWQATAASACYLGGSILQGLLVLNYDNYTPEKWHGTLLMLAILTLSVFVNTVLVRILPHIESFIFVIHIVGFFAVMIPMIYFTPVKASASEVFGSFYNGGGWSTDALTWFVGLNNVMLAFIGIDAASHMAEEIQGASVVIPQSMLGSVGINGLLGFSISIAILFCVGDIESVLGTATGSPLIQVFYNSTRSVGGASAMSSVVIAAMMFSAIGCFATGVRMTWAFARERAMPFSRHLARVEPRTALPLYSVVLCALVSAALALINIGSDVAFRVITSLSVAGSYSSFCIAAGMVLYRHLFNNKGENMLHYGPFQLGRWRLPVVVLALIYSFIGFFFSLWPPSVNPDLKTMNWSVLVFGAVVIFSIVFWFAHGKRTYHGPIMEISPRRS